MKPDPDEIITLQIKRSQLERMRNGLLLLEKIRKQQIEFRKRWPELVELFEDIERAKEDKERL